MDNNENVLAARGIVDENGRLLSADAPLAQLQRTCGGTLPGVLAIPELLEIATQCRSMNLRLAREFRASDGQAQVTGFVKAHPINDDEHFGCELLIVNWQRAELPAENHQIAGDRQNAVDRSTSEFVARLDAEQKILTMDASAYDLESLCQGIKARPGLAWSEYVQLVGVAHRQPLHWRILDGVQLTIGGSERNWTARLLPIGPSMRTPSGFELLLMADQPLLAKSAESDGTLSASSLIGDALTAALRDPIARVITNAETIRTRMAGPLRQEYSDYAGDIATAGQHLLGLLDDLSDLEVVESPDFKVSNDQIDLAEAVRKAAAILGTRAQQQNISIAGPMQEASLMAVGEMRRVVQILLNLLGNAINYAPRGSSITIHLSTDNAGFACISVTDEGPGLSQDQQVRVFRKFERLGRDGDGGSGLGLYISQRLAQAMHGSLRIESEEGKGASFTLALPQSA